MQEKERLESFWLCSIKGIGSASMKKLLQEAGSFRNIWELPDEKLSALLGEKRAECLKRGMEEKRRKSAEDRFYRMMEKGIFVLPYGDEEYPYRLKEIPDAPVLLYGKGRLPGREKRPAAIIGTRECSAYGQEMAKYFAKGLAKEGVVVVSGMARGVDGLAQSAALYAGGGSVAVLGCGVDICYPPENRKLYDRLEKEGCLLSEYPPETEPTARLFPPRNRIISGLSDLILVIEARERSGTLITVDMALEQGRDIFAVPGRVTDRCSRGCNLLIKNGAGIAVSVSQLLDELKGREKALVALPEKSGGDGKKTGKEMQRISQQAAEILDKTEAGALRPWSRRVLAALEWEPKSLDEIQRRLNAEERGDKPVQLPELMQELVFLSMEGYVGRNAGMYYLKRET